MRRLFSARPSVRWITLAVLLIQSVHAGVDAASEGRLRGQNDGAREGRERGWLDGTVSGRQRGYRDGYDRCLGDRRQRERDRGYSDGHRRGGFEGERDGRQRGDFEGRMNGELEGLRDGDRRAERDARAQAEVPAREQGRAEAERTDSFDRGVLAGAAAGEARARQTALERDYPAGRAEYRDSRLAEPVQREEQEDLARQALQTASSERRLTGPALLAGVAGLASPDYRYAVRQAPYADPELARTWLAAYRQGYGQGFHSAYDSEYRRGEQSTYGQGREQGCRDADRVDVRRDYDLGYRQGYDQGYRRAFDSAYTYSYQLSYGPAFQYASQRSYSENHPRHYARLYEQFRGEAYAERVDQLYREGFEREERASFARSYPAHAASERRRGADDEARDFADRPVRSVEVALREQMADSVLEPGEQIDFSIRMRNFSDLEVPASELRLELEVRGMGLIAVRTVDLPSRGVPARGALALRGALPLRLTEAGLGRSPIAVVSVLHRGRVMERREIELTIRTRAAIEWAERPRLREGLASPMRIQIRNRSSQPIQGPIAVSLRSDSNRVELLDTRVSIGTLAAGAQVEVIVRAIARTSNDLVELPVAVQVEDAQGARAAWRDFSGSVPVMNDYRIELISAAGSQGVGDLRRFAYRIRNVSSRLIFSALEVEARVLDADGAAVAGVQWIGFNPQYLLPLEAGEQARFVIPVLMSEGARGSTIELEVRENGIPVVIHRSSIHSNGGRGAAVP
jgi:hypothetical protein